MFVACEEIRFPEHAHSVQLTPRAIQSCVDSKTGSVDANRSMSKAHTFENALVWTGPKGVYT